MNRFPYGVLYQVSDDSILVLAIMHLKRNPARWQARAVEASPRRPRKGGR